MIQPDLVAFKRLAKKGNLIAVSKTIPADIETPVSSFLKLADKEPNAFLLESAEQEERIGRYSFIGVRPEAVFSAIRNKIYLTRKGQTSRVVTNEDLVGVIEKTLETFRLANPESLPGFSGGFMGYLSYEEVQHFESIHLNSKRGRNIPEGIFFFVKDFLLFDHFRKTLTFVALVELPAGHKKPENLYYEALDKIDASIQALQRPLRLPASRKKKSPAVIKGNMSKSFFKKKVARIKEYIRAGDCIQVVLSQRWTLRGVRRDFQIYRALRSVNPSPYMFYFRCGKLRLIGSSPELLVRNIGREVEIRPIAGTRPRGLTPKEDLSLEENLKKSRKEMAEHLMLVDLGRNDIGRVCDFNSVHVKNFARVERYSHVMHLVSDVSGKLKKGKTSFDLLRATFPAGTVTGAPKIRAMQIIDELEPEKRGPYAGCLGYFSFNHDMETCITIRTLVIYGNEIDLQAGAGIVKDSNPEREYDETRNKAKALLKAIEYQENF
jgi:anthranilate synthase component 1